MATIDDLTTATTNLTTAVNVAKATLDTSVAAAQADATQTASDRIAVAADKSTVAADKATVAADRATVVADATQTAADRVAVASDRAAADADAVQTAADRVAVASDRAAADADKTTTSGYKDAASTSATAAAASAAAAAASAVTAASVLPLAPPKVNTISIPGTAGFGVGICPPASLPIGFTPLPGYQEVSHVNYGNYQFQDGSIMCWIPKFWYRQAHANNPTFAAYGVNSVDIKGLETFTSTAEANAAGYALERMFLDGGVELPGVFVDKYGCSKNPWGTGFIASSIPFGLPISTASTHNPIAELTATAGINNYYACITAAHARDGVNGAVNPASIFFASSRFIRSGLARLSLAHGQAATSATFCAWYDDTKVMNFPKGNNNNALKDVNDTSVTYISDGYTNCGKAGSGSPFAKTTHNGQACGIADLNGNLWAVEPGLTCVATSKAITAVALTNPCQITVAAHGNTTGQPIQIESIAGTTQLNNKLFTVTVVDANTLSLNGVDATAYTPYTAGGTSTSGIFYAVKPATAMRTLTAGNTLATDAWGAVGVAAHSAPISMPFDTLGGGVFDRKFGNAANQVLSDALAGDPWILSGLGLPKDGAGVSAAGSNLFGSDYLYQHIENDLCVLSGGGWSDTASAGVWRVNLNDYRSHSNYNVGFRCACYPVA